MDSRARRLALAALLCVSYSCGDEGGPGEDTLSLALSAAAADETVLLGRAGTWWVWDQGGDLGTAWRAKDFEETGWTSLRAPLGYGESYVTPISYGPDASNKHITSYFRKKFFVEDAAAIGSLRLEMMYDDGFVFYLNGQEGGRASMPSGTITASTEASGHEAGNTYVSFDITSVKGALVDGWNMLAVEVHQQAPSSSDLVFDASVIAGLSGGGPPPPVEGGVVEEVWIPRGGAWTYWDKGWPYRVHWTFHSTDTSDWETGPGPLGYGEPYLATVVSYGSDPANKHISTYFRKLFFVKDVSKVVSVRLDAMYDDGFVYYVNGYESGRVGIPTGNFSYGTLAEGHEALNTYESLDGSFIPGNLVNGWNVLAVEVHQQAKSSSDLVFDFSIVAQVEEEAVPPPTAGGFDAGSAWTCWARGGELGTAWREGLYDDSDWEFNRGPFGYGESYLRTFVSFGTDPGNKFITTYFRKKFLVNDPAAVTDLRSWAMYDDGFVVYLNGQEIQRTSMPSGAVTSTTRAFAHEAGNVYQAFDWNSKTPFLIAGENTIAVEVHQAAPTSSDLVFDLALVVGDGSAPPSSVETIARGSSWHFDDNGFGMKAGWHDAPDFNHQFDGEGPGPLGYGERYIRTTVSFGSDPSRKPVTTYFRREFTARQLHLLTALHGAVMYDDGVVVFINGHEVQRLSMPSGTIGHSTLAFDHEAGNAYAVLDWSHARAFLREGVNVITAEAHQASRASSDLVFDLGLTLSYGP